jgi:hypothetical protein
LEAQGLPTRWELQLGDTPGLLGEQASGGGTGTIPLELSVADLTPGTRYYYRLIAVNPDSPVNPGTNEISEGSFTTAPAAAGAAPPAAPALVPYTTIAQYEAKEPKESKGTGKGTALTKAQKLAKALKSCERDKKKGKRVACEATARKRYGPPHKAKTKGGKR